MNFQSDRKEKQTLKKITCLENQTDPKQCQDLNSHVFLFQQEKRSHNKPLQIVRKCKYHPGVPVC